MKRKNITVMICLITVLVFTVVAILFIKSLGKSENPENPRSDSQEVSGEVTPEPDSTDETDKPDENKPDESEKDNKTEEPEKNDKTEQPDKTPEPITAAENYKNFALLKGMSAKEAYDYLTEFLDSKFSVLVNKDNLISSDYGPENPTVPSGYDYKLEKEAADALAKMLKDAKADGIYDLEFYSGYRSYNTQKNKFVTRTQRYLDQGYSQQEAEKKAGEYIAPPGSSEHQTGLAADVCSYAIVSKYGYLSDDFDTTKEWRWLNDHCTDYGFILRYRKDSEDITGFLYEPWHFRYLGVEHAKACTELSIPYEKYHELLVKYQAQAKADAGV